MLSNSFSIGKYLRIIRKDRTLTLTQLSTILDIDYATISRIERGERLPTIEQLKTYADYFHLDMKDLEVEELSDKVAYTLLKEDSYKKILSLAEEKIRFHLQANPKIENSGIISSRKKYFIRPKGIGNMKVYMLIHFINFDVLDIFFQTINEAKEYARKNNIEIIEYIED